MCGYGLTPSVRAWTHFFASNFCFVQNLDVSQSGQTYVDPIIDYGSQSMKSALRQYPFQYSIFVHDVDHQ